MTQIYTVTVNFLRAGLAFLLSEDPLSEALDKQRYRAERLRVMHRT